MKYVHTISVLGFLLILIIAYSLFNEVSSKEALKSENKLGPIAVSFTHNTDQKEAIFNPSLDNKVAENLSYSQTKSKKVDKIDNEEEIEKDNEEEKPNIKKQEKITKNKQTPFFSQFTDISDPSWQKVGCGIASLAMIIELYNPGKVSVDNLLTEGIKSGAYLNDAGWIHNGLIQLAQNYGLNGKTRDLSSLNTKSALTELEKTLDKGPVMVSVHYTFDPTNPIPHLVVINKIIGDTVYYNDPSEKAGNGSVSTTQFLKAWKKRYIEIRPV